MITWFFELYYVFVISWQWTLALPLIFVFGVPFYVDQWVQHTWPMAYQSVAQYQVLVGYLLPSVLFAMGLLFLMQVAWKTYRLFQKDKRQVATLTWLAIFVAWWMIIVVLMPKFFYENFNSGSPWEAFLSMVMMVALMFGYSSVVWFTWLGMKLGLRWVLNQVWPKKYQAWRRRASSFLTTIIIVYLLSVPLAVLSWFYYDPTQDRASDYFKIHAAIKNTCLLDPKREHCPQQLSDLEIIEPAEYQRLMKCCQLNYTYNPETNYYTLVVRYNPIKAVIFDQRLIPETGLDLKDTTVQVIGRDRITDPPGYDGPWTFPDWEYTVR